LIILINLSHRTKTPIIFNNTPIPYQRFHNLNFILYIFCLFLILNNNLFHCCWFLFKHYIKNSRIP
jgi:hypothetical protein